MPWPCFWVEPTGEVELDLRRYIFVKDAGRRCRTGSTLHSRATPLEGRHPARMTADHAYELWPAEEFADDPRWPIACRCGYEFTERAIRHVSQHPVYRRPDTGEEYVERSSLPIGALYDSPWYGNFGVGPDGIALQCVLPKANGRPDHAWHIDGPSSSQPGKPNVWTRTGDPRSCPPTVDVNPSILTPEYHGYLRHGVLTDPL